MNSLVEQAILSKKEGQDLLKIAHQTQWYSYLKTIGLNPDEQINLSWENVEDLLALQLFLKASYSKNKHKLAQFSQLYQKGRTAVLKTLCRLEIPVKLEKKKLLRRYRTQILPNRTIGI